MRNGLYLNIFADRVGKRIREEKSFERAFSLCFSDSTYFENEREIVKSNVGRILNEKKQAKRKRKEERNLHFLLVGSQSMMEEAHEFECPIQ